MHKYLYSLLFCLTIMSFCACSSDEEPGKSGVNTITSFRLQAALNSQSIKQDYQATIDGTNILICIPTLTDFKDLVVTFSVGGGTVTVNGVQQVSGVTKNDFTNPLTYIVTADNGEKRSYTVDICNTHLPVVYINTSDGKAITSK